MSFGELAFLIRSDLYRIYGCTSISLLFKELLLGIGFRYTFWMRVVHWLSRRSFGWAPVYLVCKLILRHYMFKFGIDVSFPASIGPGFYIGHFGGIMINSAARIGRNCNISQDVTIGMSFRGERAGAPTLGDGVYIGPGAKIFGKIRIGDDVAIGANCVVTKDVPDHAVVVGVPGRVISLDGASGYINHTDY